MCVSRPVWVALPPQGTLSASLWFLQAVSPPAPARGPAPSNRESRASLESSFLPPP